ncbi:MAG TPA: hypothetical protein DCW90_18135 [Lachnospiraceae bacterium]|nr:GerMN domain-containing protein [uncultured Lachnoclostridium sp.]HAU87327.1 hypothetical protein [Lachnospiraceae bacterium]
MQKSKIIIVLLCFISVLALMGCNKKEHSENKKNEYEIYYCNSEETELVSASYEAKATDAMDLISELIDAMSKVPKSLQYKKVKPDNVELLTFELNDDGQLILHFNSNYSNLTGISEIFLRAAVVKMMCQIKGVECVEIYVEDQPLMQSADKPYGFETAEDFIDNTGRETNFSQNVTMSLYFANKKGNRLKEVDVSVTYDGTISLEQLIIQRLIDGPGVIKNIENEEVKATIPKGTVVQKTAIREGVCYVYLNKKFMNKLPDITDEVAIYSIVNSLCEMSSINKVQFMIDGVAVPTYREKIKFDGFFERNLDIVIN